jgi:signal transduction histidine kinase
VDGAVRRLRRVVGLGTTRAEAAEELFGAIRWRLVLWYSGVLAVALLLSGVVLYLGVRQALLSPVETGLRQNTQVLAQRWQAIQLHFPNPQAACGSDHFAPDDTLFACYDSAGHIVGEGRFIAHFANDFDSSTLVAAALRNGHAQDTIDSHGPLGTLERYAVAVPSTADGPPLGVMQLGAQVGPQLHKLDNLLRLLFVLGALTLVFAAVGGLFLANRALQPARLAHARQRDFIADASHELRTPLTLLRSNVEVVLRGRDRLPPEDVELLEDTVMEAAHLASLANNMLDLARLEAGGSHLERDVVDLSEVVAEVARWTQTHAASREVHLRQGGDASALVLGDRTLLEQAVMSLVDNAVKYNQPGGAVDVLVRHEGQTVQVQVRDTGIGIDASHLAHLGERFYRVDKARSRESGGAGLGLSIVRRIADRHGGSFEIESDAGQGTTATLTLPAIDGPPRHA